MAIEKFAPTSLEHLIEFIKNPVNDIDHMWIYNNGDFLGSIMPKVTDWILTYSNLEQLIMMVYNNNDDDTLRRNIIINNSDLSHYQFWYI